MTTAQTGVIIPMPAPAVDPAIKENLGSRVSSLIQTYNDMKRELMAQPEHPIKAQLQALLEKRRAAVEAIFAKFKPALDAILGAGQAKLSGVGAFETNEIQTQLGAEQTKFAALQSYFDSYKAAIAAGTTPPALPAELQEGSFAGISSTTLAILVAIAALGYFWFQKDR